MPTVRPNIDWDIHSTTVILKPEDVDPALHDEERNNWFMCWCPNVESSGAAQSMSGIL